MKLLKRLGLPEEVHVKNATHLLQKERGAPRGIGGDFRGQSA